MSASPTTGDITSREREVRFVPVAEVMDSIIRALAFSRWVFLKEGGTPTEYSAGLNYAILQGWLWKHESGTYVKFTPSGAELFARPTLGTVFSALRSYS